MFEQILEILITILAELKKLNMTCDTAEPLQPVQSASVMRDVVPAAAPLPAIPPKAEIPTAAPIVPPVPNSAAGNAPAVTREACGKALIGLGTAKGRDAAVAVLAQFKATKVAEVPEVEFGNFLAAIAKASA